jgi:nitrite reductase (NO-forming)
MIAYNRVMRVALATSLLAPLPVLASQLPPVTADMTMRPVDVPATDAATLDLLPALPTGHTAYVKLALIDKVVEVSPGIKYRAWTFNGVVPGPVIHARVGDTLDVTLTNKASMGHSIDFHAALVPPNVAYQTIQPGRL